MCQWRIVIKAKCFWQIRSGISPLILCGASYLLDREQLWYSYKFKSGIVLNHLIMGNFKLFAKSEDQLESLICFTHSFSVLIRMKFGFQICTSAVLQVGINFLMALSRILAVQKYLKIYEAGSSSNDYPKTKNMI